MNSWVQLSDDRTLVLVLAWAALISAAHGTRLTSADVALIVPVLSGAMSLLAAEVLGRRRPRHWGNSEHLVREYRALARENRALRARLARLEDLDREAT